MPLQGWIAGKGPAMTKIVTLRQIQTCYGASNRAMTGTWSLGWGA